MTDEFEQSMLGNIVGAVWASMASLMTPRVTQVYVPGVGAFNAAATSPAAAAVQLDLFNVR